MKYFHNILSLLFILFFSEVLSQKITLVDSTSGRPIRGVLVFDSERTTRAVSNRNGLVNLNNFKDSDSIFFTHIVYVRKTLLYNSLKEGDNIILSPKALGLNEVVLSVSRNMQNVMTLSRKVSVINRSSTNLDIPRNTAEMLYHGGGIHVQKSQSGGGSLPSRRPSPSSTRRACCCPHRVSARRIAVLTWPDMQMARRSKATGHPPCLW